MEGMHVWEGFGAVKYYNCMPRRLMEGVGVRDTWRDGIGWEGSEVGAKASVGRMGLLA